MKQQIYQEIFNFKPESLKPLNDMLRWLYKKVMGGIGMKDLNSAARTVIESKADDSTIRTVIEQTEKKIKLEVVETVNTINNDITNLSGAVEKNTADISVQAGQIESKVSQEKFDALGNKVDDNTAAIALTAKQITAEVSSIKVGGTQLLTGTRSFAGWLYGSRVSIDAGEDGFYRATLAASGLTSDAWTMLQSPVMQLPSGWMGRQVTLSAWVYSDDWAGMDTGGQTPVSWAMCLSKGGTERLNYGSKYLIPTGKVELTDSFVSDTPFANGKWCRVSTTYTLDATDLPYGSSVFEDNTHIFVQLTLWRNGAFRLYAPKLEFGNRATEWSENPADVQADIDALGGNMDALGQAVEKNTAAISVQAGQIESKVSHESFNAFGKKVDEDISRISQTSEEILLEVKKPSTAVDTGDEGVQVKISKDRFEVNVPGEDGDFELNESGGRLPVLVSQDVSAPNVTPRYAGRTWLYVNPSATSAQIATGSYFRSLSDAFSKLSGKYLDAEVTINLVAGMMEYGTPTLEGVIGRGRVNIASSSTAPAKVVGQLKLADNGVWVYVRYLDADTTSIGVDVENCQRVQLEYCTVNGPGVSVSGTRAVYAHSGSNVTANNCGLYGCERSLYAYSNSSIDGGNNKGNCRVAVNRAMMYLQGTQPCDSATWTAAKWAGEVYTANVTVDQGSAAVPEGEPTTASFMMVHSDSYVTGWSYFSDNDIRQGCINSAENRIRGCMWFDNAALRSLLTGKTVQQASIKLYAATGVGRGVSVSVELYGTTAQYEGRSEAPALARSYGTIGTVTPGEAVSITIPIEAVGDLVGGDINGFVLYSDDTELHKDRSYSKNYARFMGETSGDDATKPVLTVMYK